MQNNIKKIIFILVFHIGYFISPTHGQCTDTTGIIYVDQDAVGANTGICWTDAFDDLQDALAMATAGDQIWVAEGLYAPATLLTNWLITFNLVDSVAMYGGFAGTEDSLHQRDWLVNETILTGDINGYSVYTVVNAHLTGSETILDGFIIENGAAMIENIPSAIYNDTSSARYSNCIIRSNHTFTSSGNDIYDYGVGAILNVSGAPSFYNCKIIDNSSHTRKANNSAGACLNVDSDAFFNNCEFENNVASTNISSSFVAGGLINIGGEQSIVNCLFSGNTCQNGNFYSITAGALINRSSNTVIDTCEFTLNITHSSNNYSQTAGGILNYQSSPAFNHCHITENSGSVTNGRPFMAGGMINMLSSPVIKDCIIESNYASTEFAAGGVMNFSSDPVFIRCKINKNTVQHSIPESYSTGIGGVLNSGGNPIFSHCDISGNTVSSSCLFSSEVAGGFLNDTSKVTLINCNITNNSAHCATNTYVLIAGGSLGRNDSITIQNCTMANNSSFGYGSDVNNSGGILALSSHHQVTNSIIYGNEITANGNRSIDVLVSGGSFYSDHCLFEEYAGGSNNYVNINPSFIDADTVGSGALGDYRLRAESVGVNAGSLDHLPIDQFDLDSDSITLEKIPVDLANNNRIMSCGVDLGAYENTTEIQCPEPKVLTGDSVITCSGSYTATLLESDTNTWYYLVDATLGKRIGGLKMGTGSALDLSTGFLSEASYRAFGVDKNNKAYRFGGENHFVQVPTNSQLNLDSIFTISCWIKLTDSLPGSGILLNRGENYSLSFDVSDTSIHFLSNYYTGDDPSLSTSLALVQDTCWHYIAYTYDGDTMRGYVDDVLRFSEAKNFVLDSIESDLIIGAADSISGSVPMVLDDIRIWNTCNSALQLKNEKSTCGQLMSPGLLAFYRFNEDSLLLDHSGNGLDGNLSTGFIPKQISSGICVSNTVQFSYVPDSSARIIYVNGNIENGWNNGYCWADAFMDLQSALAVADSGDQIWVAEGIYRPTQNLDRSISFVIPDGVGIFGGFEGHETSLSQRNWATHPTILEGELATDVHTYTIVKSINSGPTTILDGFTIRGGKCDHSGCAGGIYTESSQAQFSHCIIIDNGANDQSGSNESIVAGGVYNKNGSPLFMNCTMANNSAYTLAYPFSAAGGAVFNENTHAQFINCTMSGNNAAPFSYVSEYGAGAVLCYNDSSSYYNCIVWGNMAMALTEVSDIYSLSSVIIVESCLLEEYSTGVNCFVGQDPLFIDSDYRLDSLSPAINQGIASVLPSDIFDLDGDNNLLESFPYAMDGMSRTQACVPDMGVHELPQRSRFISGSPNTGIYKAENYIISNASINNPNLIEFHAGNYVELINSFEVEPGAIFEIHIGPCDTD